MVLCIQGSFLIYRNQRPPEGVFRAALNRQVLPRDLPPFEFRSS